MNDSQRNAPTHKLDSPKWIGGNGLRAKLLRSHIVIALLGIGMLGVALVTVLSMRATGVHLAESDGPLVWHSMRAMTGLQRSLAGLRGWIALGDKSFIQERNKAWKNEIKPSIKTLEALCQAAGDSEQTQQIQRAKRLLQDLEEAQWWIEDIAQTPGNMPAKVIMIKNAEPIGRSLDSTITALLELEKRRESGALRKSALGKIADLRFSFASSQKTLRDLVFSGKALSRKKLRHDLDVVSERIDSITAKAKLFTPHQQTLLSRISDEFQQYLVFCENIIAVPADQWYIARHLLATQTAPIATEVTLVLERVAAQHKRAMGKANRELATTSDMGVAMLVLMLLAMAATATFLSIRGARRITQPISVLAQATRDLAAGRLRENIPVFVTDELGRLAIAFNTMRENLREKDEALHESETRMRTIVSTAADGIITIDEKGILQSLNAAAEKMFGYSESEMIGKNVSLLMPPPYREEHDSYLQRYLETGVKTILGGHREVSGRRKDGSTFPMDLTASEARIGDCHIFTGIVRDVTKRKKAEEDLRRFRAAIDASADGIFLIDRKTMRFVDASKSACESVGYTHEEILAMSPHDLKPEFTKEQLAEKYEKFVKLQTTCGVIETVHRCKDGSLFPVEIMLRFLERGGQQIVIAVTRDITERKWAEQQLEELHKKVVDASRQAGMAEIATGVLHNVGNVLNSVNVSATLVADKIRKSKVSGLSKAVGLMHEHANDLGIFITEDEKGKKLPAYLERLSQHLAAEQGSVMGELKELTKNIEHIKKIVSMQQSHAGGYGVVETVSIAEVVDDALTVNATSFERYGIEMVREYADLPLMVLDKQKLLQILVNLVRNGKHAVLDGECKDKRLTLRIERNGETRVCIKVIDNGMGIAAEHLTKIFSHGFTTKDDGHGFGLHSAALAAKEMRGSLNVHSDGPNMGATFTLDLPIERTEVTA